MGDAEPDSATVVRAPSALESSVHGSVAVLVLDPTSMGTGLPRTWSPLAGEIRVLWLAMSTVEDPLVHARALLERQVDDGVPVCVVTSREAEELAMIVAAHRAEVVRAVYVLPSACGFEGVREISLGYTANLRAMLEKNEVIVRLIGSTIPLSRPTEHMPCLDHAEVIEVVSRELREIGLLSPQADQ